MKRKHYLTIALVTALLLTLPISGCDRNGPEPAAPTSFGVTVRNDTNYTFDNLFISSSASDVWGADHLGSSLTLRSGGSFDITLGIADTDNFDIKVIDEDEDEYIFKRVPLRDGAVIEIFFSDGPTARVIASGGSETVVSGELILTGGEEHDLPDDGLREFTFVMYNETGWVITSIWFTNTQTGEDYGNQLTEDLQPGSTKTISGFAGDTEELEINVFDVDGDTNVGTFTFMPLNLNYMDILWDTELGGYVIEFFYH